jgi:hypothetical protein
MSNPTVVSALGSQYTIQMVRDTTQYFQFTLLEREIGVRAFTPVDLTAATVVFTVRDRLGGTLIFQKVNDPGEHQDNQDGTTRFIVDTDDFAAVALSAWTTLVFEVRRIEGADQFVHISGDFILKWTPAPDDLGSPSPSPSVGP